MVDSVLGTYKVAEIRPFRIEVPQADLLALAQ
jgi:hypothetical protein